MAVCIMTLTTLQATAQQLPAPSSADSTTYRSRFAVSPTTPNDARDLTTAHPADLQMPGNVKSVVEYDWRNNRYLIKTMLGEKQIGHPIPMTMQEYRRYTELQARGAHFLDLYHKDVEAEEGKNGFDLLDMQFSLGPAEKIFGPGGIRVKTQGSASMSMGMKHNVVDNPTLSERARDQWTFDFDEQIQLSMKASIGSKKSIDMN